ncbi:SET family sugar efflux transporter-like MFS transporter [Thermocatellispora tengchongensis]|uniref:SET family sugar efflux transporter-like MFS transporter n=1 Tax=Thermocatellispora tengchongensis TaxID=1073253 RepID=A0A840PG28_9ACTN|nr:sugar efflux transporter [Thermocatellispora tengchongensis]MBB5136097.1 SET family sugar efflux transporter-like MFS transporter [Thermocatellispora tengchongensis]
MYSTRTSGLRIFLDGAVTRLATATAAIGVGGAMVVPTVSLFLSDAVHATPIMIGAFVAGRAVAEISSDLAVGVLSDRVGSRRIVLGVCSMFAAAGALSYLFLRDYWLLLATTAVMFGIGGATFPQLYAFTRELAEQQGHNATFFNSALRSVTSLGWIVGPPLAFGLIALRGFETMYAVAAVLYFAGGLICFLGLPDAAPRPVGEPGAAPERRTGNPFAGLTPKVRVLLVAIVLLLAVNAMYQFDIALYITKDLGMDEGFTGLVLGLASALEIPAMVYIGAKADRIGHWRVITGAAACAVLFFCAMPFARTELALLLLQVPNAIWCAIALSIPVTVLQNAMPDRPGVASSLYSGAFKTGMFLGGIAAGSVAQYVGFTNVFWACAALSALAFFAVAFWRET